MHALWHWILYVLTATSADPQLLEHERARTAGAVNVAYASTAAEPAPAPKRDDQPAAVKASEADKFPLFVKHCQKCKQCADPNPDGPGLCVDGFKLWQQDLRNARGTAKPNPLDQFFPDRLQAAPIAPPCPCGGRGYTVRPDGSRWACQCKPCQTGKCPQR